MCYKLKEEAMQENLGSYDVYTEEKLYINLLFIAA